MNETRISQIESILDQIINVSANQETTKIIPNAEVIDAAPSWLSASYIIVEDDTGHYIPALKIPGVIYTNGDNVNLLMMKGTEPVAMQQGSSSVAAGGVGGWPFANVLTVSTTDPNADYTTIAAANTAASAGDIILLDAETWGNASITKAVTLMGLDPVNTILTATGGSTLTIAGANGISVRNLTLDNTGSGTDHTCLDLTQGYDDHVIDNVIITKTSGGNSGESRGIYNVNGTNILLNNVRVSITDGGTKYGYLSKITTGSSARIVGGSYEGDTDDIRLDDAQASVELNDPVLENGDLNIVAGSATGGYFDGSGNYRLLDDVGIGASPAAVKLGVDGLTQTTGVIRAGGATLTGATGAALETFQTGGVAQVQGYDRTGAAYIPLRVIGSTVDLFIGASAGLSMDANRIITMPVQPSFLAHNSVTDSNVTGDGTVVTVEFDTEIYDKNADYNTTTDTFTAPVTGKYLFAVSVFLQGIDGSHVTVQIKLITSNRNYNLLYAHSNIANLAGDLIVRLPAQVDMDANDTAYVTAMINTGTKTIDIGGSASSDPETSFAGTLMH